MPRANKIKPTIRDLSDRTELLRRAYNELESAHRKTDLAVGQLATTTAAGLEAIRAEVGAAIDESENELASRQNFMSELLETATRNEINRLETEQTELRTQIRRLYTLLLLTWTVIAVLAFAFVRWGMS